MKKILIAGDSFGFGQGCSDRLFYIDPETKKQIGNQNLVYQGPSKFCWSSLLQEDYPNYKVINLSYPGSDNMSIASAIYKNLSEDVELIIFAGAAADRIQISNPKYPDVPVSWLVGSVPSIDEYPTDWVKATEYYTKYLYNQDAVTSITVNAVTSIYGLSALNTCKFLYSVQPVIKPEKIDKWLSKLDKYKMIDMYNFIYGKSTGLPDYIAEDGHANDLGHLQYYKQIIKPALERIEL